MGDNTIPFKIQWCVINSLNDRWKNLHPIGHNLGATKPKLIFNIKPPISGWSRRWSQMFLAKQQLVKWSWMNSQDVLADLPV